MTGLTNQSDYFRVFSIFDSWSYFVNLFTLVNMKSFKSNIFAVVRIVVFCYD